MKMLLSYLSVFMLAGVVPVSISQPGLGKPAARPQIAESAAIHIAANQEPNIPPPEFYPEGSAMQIQSRREALVRRVELEDLDQSLLCLTKESISFGSFSTIFLGDGSGFTSYQTDLLTDPRIAKLIAFDLHGSDEQKLAIKKFLISALSDYLDQYEAAIAAKKAPPAVNSIVAFPILLAEVDVDGDSLRVLARWFRIEDAHVKELAPWYASKSHLSVEQMGDIYTPAMELAAGACLVILARLEGTDAAGAEFGWLANARMPYKAPPGASRLSIYISRFEMLPETSYTLAIQIIEMAEKKIASDKPDTK